MADESTIGFGPSFQLCFRDSGETVNDAGLPAGSMSMSKRVPLLCVLFRLRRRRSRSEIYDTIGPRDGTQAGSSGNDTVSANILYFEE